MDLMTNQNETIQVEGVLNQRDHFAHPSGKVSVQNFRKVEACTEKFGK